MVYRSWQIARPDPARRDALCAALELPRLVCGVLCARGLDTPEAARAVVCGEDAPFPRWSAFTAPSMAASASPYSAIMMWTALRPLRFCTCTSIP